MLKKTDIIQVNESAIKLIGFDWMLVTAGTMEKFNTMTAAWGGLGLLWHKPVAFIFIRPTRYTYKFTEEHEYFSLCFFEEKYREQLQYCGSHSGKNVDKMKETGLIPLKYNEKVLYFEQARLVLICRKLYHHDLDPKTFLDPGIEHCYPEKDYHRLYIGEIEDTLMAG
jgi:flavin reductase (DIM6/NTAB) family NADH-FMN oxidoreductase RutF